MDKAKKSVAPPQHANLDRVEILELIARFNRAADTGAPDELADTFVEDGVFHGLRGVATGREELKAFVVETHLNPSGALPGRSRHMTYNVVVDFREENAASVSADLLMVSASGDGFSITMMGYYFDEVVRTPHGWRFVRRRVNRINDTPAS